MKPTKPAAPGSVFSLSGVPPAGELIPLGLQHVVAAIVGIITPAIMVSNTCASGQPNATFLRIVESIIKMLCGI